MITDTLSEYAASIIATCVRSKIRTTVRGLASGKTSLINAGNNNIVSFPVIVSDGIPHDVAEDIMKDVETVLAIATKNFIEGDINRAPDDLSMDAIMASLPITRINRGNNDMSTPTGALTAISYVSKEDSDTLYSEALQRAQAKFLELGTDGFRQYAEAQGIELYRERGSSGTFIRVLIPYITGKGEIKNVEVQLGFEGIIRFVPTEELVTRIGAFDPNRFFKSFIKLQKKEISFMSDFLLEMDRLKVEAKSAATSNYLWKTLETMNRSRDVFVNSYPFATFVISDFVSDEIKDKFAIDTKQDKHIKALMKSFFAFAFYEVNTSTNVINVMRDGDNMSRKTTVDDIVRNTTKVERKLRELVKLG